MSNIFEFDKKTMAAVAKLAKELGISNAEVLRRAIALLVEAKNTAKDNTIVLNGQQITF